MLETRHSRIGTYTSGFVKPLPTGYMYDGLRLDGSTNPAPAGVSISALIT